jgi:large subunit ribosomal protein L35
MTARIQMKENTMPKMKTKRSAAKRFGVTGSGKFRRRRQNLRHILTKKSAKRKMRLGQGAIVDSANAGAVRRMLPYA